MLRRSLIQIVSPAARAALAGAAAVLLLQALDAGAALEWRRGVLAAQPWRLLTGHLVHVGWRHAALNAAAWIAVARLFAAELAPRRQLALFVACGLGTSAALWLLDPPLLWYRGASGVLHGLFAAGALDALLASRRTAQWRLPALLLAGLWLKIGVEQAGAGTLAPAAWLGAAVVTPAHLAGAVSGTLAMLALRAVRPAAPGP
jgi:rhomboid family GlyGly-CTERM serine protease